MKVMRENIGLLIAALIIALLIKSYVYFIDPPTEVELTAPVQPRNLAQGLSVSSVNPARVGLTISGAKSKVEKYSERNFTAIADCSKITVEGNYEVDVRLSQSRLRGVKFDLDPKTAYLGIGRSEQKFFNPQAQQIGEIKGNRVISKIEGLPDTVQVSGSAKFLELVDKVVYRLNLDHPGDSWTDQVTFISTDKNGRIIESLKLDPPEAPITVYLRENRIKQLLPVILRTRGTPANNYTVISQTITPQEVEASGDPAIIAALANVETEWVSIAGASSDISSEVNLISPDQKVTLKPAKVAITISISQTQTQREIGSLSIELKRQVSGFSYRVSPPTINVRVRGPLEKISNLDITLIHPSIDVSIYNAGTYSITLDSPGLPSDVALLSMTPTEVELTVTKTGQE